MVVLSPMTFSPTFSPLGVITRSAYSVAEFLRVSTQVITSQWMTPRAVSLLDFSIGTSFYRISRVLFGGPGSQMQGIYAALIVFVTVLMAFMENVRLFFGEDTSKRLEHKAMGDHSCGLGWSKSTISLRVLSASPEPTTVGAPLIDPDFVPESIRQEHTLHSLWS